jgi:prolyl-tRNA synthetase
VKFFETQKGYAVTFFAGDRTIEEAMKEKFNVTIRCILFQEENNQEEGSCIFTGIPTKQKVVWAKSY